jgi:hypothetical protein
MRSLNQARRSLHRPSFVTIPRGFEIVDNVPFMLRDSKHSEPFYSSLLASFCRETHDFLGSCSSASKKVATFQKARTVAPAITTSFATETS